MLNIKNLTVKLAEGHKTIIQNINLKIKPEEIHYLNGRNGSGKSTLVSTIMGNPDFEIVAGSLEFDVDSVQEFIKNELDIIDSTIDLAKLESNKRSLLGIYLAQQYPVEIPGVSLLQYLRLIYNVRRSKEAQLPVFKFKKIVEEVAETINYPKSLLSRNLNEGFSGGEKKKTEILQLLLLQPRLIMLDEVDSGLDKQSTIDIFEGLKNYYIQNPKTAFLIVSHYDNVSKFLQPDLIHEMRNGVIL